MVLSLKCENLRDYLSEIKKNEEKTPIKLHALLKVSLIMKTFPLVFSSYY